MIIAGIHTGIGKTFCSAVFCQAMGFDYWKPVQAGDTDATDSTFIRSFVSNPGTKIHPEAYLLSKATSPHLAAKNEALKITPDRIQIPETENGLIIETAGGLMSPLAENFLNIDLIQKFELPVVLVSHEYLGSINHTLLSIEALNSRKIRIAAMVYTGANNHDAANFIPDYSGIPFLFRIPVFEKIDKHTIAEFALSVKPKIESLF